MAHKIETVEGTQIPVVDPKEESGIPVAGGPPADKEYKGRYKKIQDGEIYALAVDESALDGMTHFAKNSAHYWNGTKEAFRVEFEKQ